jgi:very-short-patch-repair endonuclease
MRPGGIDAWVARERLHVVHRSVYAIGHEPLTGRGRLMAAVLASGPEAVVSHRTAAWLWDVLPDHRSTIDVTAARHRRGQRGITLHRSKLDEADRAAVEGIPVTSLARTLLDVAEVIPPRRLARAVEEAERRRLLDLTAVHDVIARGIGRRGVGRLRKAIVAYRPAPFTRSELERRFTDLVRHAGLPLPSQNVYLHGFEVDAVWESHRLVVELDGYDYHRTRAAFERDRKRDARLHAEGWTVLRFSWRQIMYAPETVVAALRTTLTQSW